MASAPSSLTEHSQTIATFHPSFRRASRFRVSRLTVSPNFSFQNRMLDAGVVQNVQCSCRCQKQPCTWIAARCLGSKISGRPGSPVTWSRYRSPRRCSARRSSSSGLVSFPWIPAIILERVILSTTSIIRSFLVSPADLFEYDFSRLGAICLRNTPLLTCLRAPAA